MDRAVQEVAISSKPTQRNKIILIVRHYGTIQNLI